VDRRAFIGTGAIVLPRLHIGEDAVVGAGAVVTRDVAAGAVVAGNPARPFSKQ
jgi:acetyltransferase-like isoleucine patch superfamily enzyme